MKKSLFAFTLILLIPLFYTSCNSDSRDGGFNLFSIEDDKQLGLQVSQEIAGNPSEYPILSNVTYQTAYSYLWNIRSAILGTGLVAYDTVFPWAMYIIKNDTVVNAFCTPGGYIYVYTGLIKTLDNEAQLAGVIAHEMAHAAKRHSTDQLTKAYGVQLLLSIVLGDNPGYLAEIAANLASGLSTLAFSRQAEYEADEFAVKYLYATTYDAFALADFFVKLEGLPRPPTFLSTHPSPEDRIAKITEHFNTCGGVHGQLYVSRYQQLKAALP